MHCRLASLRWALAPTPPMTRQSRTPMREPSARNCSAICMASSLHGHTHSAARCTQHCTT
jgi:hypothetical protein